ncbi:MAG: DUF169 domain-containing protein [Desulfurispora sp.]|uniref:DUF169 domain-containing protein n=1 Tax=Desulfurispora sp. TaxID=3014275 RepID=UPI004049B1C9
MTAVLNLSHAPLAVKFWKPGEEIPDSLERKQNLRYCQALMLAQQGHHILLNKENIACPASASAFGFRPLPDKLASGEVTFNMGIFGTREAGLKSLALMPRLPLGTCTAVQITPLAAVTIQPDVIILKATPEQLMWLALADNYDQGGRHYFQTGVFQATCIDATLVPYLTGRMNANLGCYGCRDGTDIQDSEALLGFPAANLHRIIHALERLAEKAIPRARSKNAYKNMDACDAH